ncbi:MAG: prepilin peptidase, partial [Endomicrobiales bacterium]|nr:prepilin peptidase [Endomicrobiales bacterium]
MFIFALFIFLLGLIVGSFVNVCIHRIPRNESILKPRSHCPNCNKTIKWHDNIPLLSFIVLKGKCRFCKSRISWQYPIIELLTAILFTNLAFKYYNNPAFLIIYILFTLILIIVSGIDFFHQIIPDTFNFILIIGGLLFSFINFQLGADLKIRLINSILGGLVSASCLFIVGYIGTRIFNKDAMGGGDIKLIAGIGTFFGISKTLLVIFIGSLLGSIIGISLITLNKLDKREYIPFGPFLAASAYLSIFIPNDWIVNNIYLFNIAFW